MFDQMKKLMEMKQQAEKIKRQLEASLIEVTEGEGVKIVIDGAQKFHSLEIDENLLVPEKKQHLQKELVKSLNKAIGKSQSVAADQMKKVMGLGGLPGF
ncbi:MAG: YbaB/EbfC family nucleoid-associated protein [Candidatus Omnitrophota bacterium]